MKRLAFGAWFCLVLSGCPGPATTPDGGVDSGVMVDEISVAGTARVFPEAAKYLVDAGLPVTSMSGLTLTVEEPLKVAIGDPSGLFGQLTLDGTGAFSVAHVNVDMINLGLAAGVRDDFDGGCAADGGACGPRVVRSASTLFDVALEGQKPDHDLTQAAAWAIPTAFEERLSACVGETAIRGITQGADAGTLISAGFMLGQVIDAQGAPVAGVKVSTDTVAMTKRFFYPNLDYSATQATTAAHGIFIYVHNAGEVVPFKFGIEGRSEYLRRNAGAARNACLVTRVYPGKVAPP